MQAPSRQNGSVDAQRLSYRAKVMYGVGDIANAIKVVTFGLYSLFFATVVKGIPGTWVGAVGFVAMFWDAAIDPGIGYLTDGPRASTKRFNFMLTGALTMGIGFWAFFSPPSHLSTVMLCAWLLAASFVVRTATSIYSIPYYALGMILSRDYHERTSITGIRSLASGIGTLLTASLSFVLFFPEKVKGVDPKLEQKGYTWMGLAFGVIMTLVALTALFGTSRLAPQLEESTSPAEQSPREFFKNMWNSLHNPSFRVMLIAFSLAVVALTVNGTLGLHFLKYFAEVSGSVALSSFQAIFFIAGLAGVLFWLRLSTRLEKHHLFAISTFVTALISVAAVLLFGKGHLFGTGHPGPLLVGYGLAGFFSSVVWFIPQSMLADVADNSELVGGSRREGSLYGFFSFIQQAATGVAVMLAGLLLDRFVGLVPGQAEQSISVASRIGVVYSVVPAALLIASAGVMLGYPLTRAQVESIQTELQRRQFPQQVSNVD